LKISKTELSTPKTSTRSAQYFWNYIYCCVVHVLSFQ